MSLLPALSETNAILVPSGLHRGHSSFSGPEVSWRPSPPFAGIVQMSPRSENATCRPSALTCTCSPPEVIVRSSRPLFRRSLLTVSGSGVGFDNDSVVPYRSVYDLFYNFAQSALDRQQVPITLKDFVRDYFSRLEPTE